MAPIEVRPFQRRDREQLAALGNAHIEVVPVGLYVDEALRRRGIATWLVGHAADWLRLARVERRLD